MKISEQGNRAIRTVWAEQNELGQKMLLAVGVEIRVSGNWIFDVYSYTTVGKH